MYQLIPEIGHLLLLSVYTWVGAPAPPVSLHQSVGVRYKQERIPVVEVPKEKPVVGFCANSPPPRPNDDVVVLVVAVPSPPSEKPPVLPPVVL